MTGVIALAPGQNHALDGPTGLWRYRQALARMARENPDHLAYYLERVSYLVGGGIKGRTIWQD